jgi:hypothetical protein
MRKVLELMLRKLSLAFALVAAVISLAACDPQGLINSFAPKEQSQEARKYIDDIRAGNFAEITPKLSKEYFSGDPLPLLKQVNDYFPREQPKSVKVVGSNVVTSDGVTRYWFTFEYEFSKSWVLIQIVLETKDRRDQIIGFHVWKISESLEAANAFNLSNKTPLEYAILVFAAFMPLFTIGTAIVAFRSYIPKRKWLWIIFVLLGFGQLSLNWATGATNVSVLSFLLFGASYTQMFYGPPLISVGFPLGAVLFWTRRSRWKALQQTQLKKTFE